MPSKQVIVMRKFPGLRTGKFIAQGCHGSLGALLSLTKHDVEANCLVIPLHNIFINQWIFGQFTKIVVYVNTEEELRELQINANAAGLPNALITDAGHTEFNGVPTVTCLGIGPGDSTIIDTITGHLPLF